ncbi:hypothetical protein H4217_000963 [Coemansia sp. RSA 1939]|nr:hypothetical protein H4217_000963 [Coemansia sp. RSA 1939]
MTSFEEDLEEYLAAKTTESLSTVENTVAFHAAANNEDERRQSTIVQSKQDQLLEGFEVSTDPRYAFNRSTGIWLDLHTGEQSFYDQDTQTYIPAQQIESVPDQSDFQGVLRLVVVESECWPKGNVVDINANDGGLAIGRDRLQDHTVHQLRIPEIEISRYHARIYAEPANNAEHEGMSPIQRAGSEDGEIETVNAESISDGDCLLHDRIHKCDPVLQNCVKLSMFIVDQGSTHGTFVNGTRLSDPKTTSKPQLLCHLDTVKVGQTTLELHVHEQWACAKCHNSGSNEIPTLPNSGDRSSQGQDKQLAGTYSGLSTIKDNHSDKDNTGDNSNKKQKENPNALGQRHAHTEKRGNKSGAAYTDRARLRRQLQGQSHQKFEAGKSETLWQKVHPSEACEGIVPQQTTTYRAPIEQSNKGFSLLQKIGWTPGSGLGANESGIVNPVEVAGNDSRAGLGAPTDQEQEESRKGRVARITQERFYG